MPPSVFAEIAAMVVAMRPECDSMPELLIC